MTIRHSPKKKEHDKRQCVHEHFHFCGINFIFHFKCIKGVPCKASTKEKLQNGNTKFFECNVLPPIGNNCRGLSTNFVLS
jgi:hypothetical protein